MNRRRFRFASPALILTLALGALGRPAHAVATTPITIDPTNPQYFFYDNQTIALVGTTAEYLCHVTQPEDTGYYCTFSNHPQFLTDLQTRGLNKIRIWLGLNHSPGQEPNRPGVAYADEQPFVYLGGGIWDWDHFSTTYSQHVKTVLQNAAAANVIVEVVLFDPWSGDWTKGPWHPTKNNRSKGFTARNKFVTGTVAAGSADETAQNKQLEFVDWIATELNGFHNFYWEVANEPDLIAANSSLSITAITDWHDKIIRRLRAKELTLPNGPHLIAVNYHTDTALATIRDNTYPLSVPFIGLVNGHYVAVSDYTSPTRVRSGAIELENNWQIGPSASLAKAFGFNETRISPFQTTLRSLRAEAWEFMLKEGGSYDHYGYDWQSASAGNYRTQLGKLAAFLKTVDLRNMARPTGTTPFWVSGLGTYGASNKYWAAMQKVRHQYVLYIHHSTIDYTVPGDPTVTQFAKYTPVAGSYTENLNVNLGSIAGTFDADWIDPVTGNALSSVLGIAWDPATMTSVNFVSPPYAFDIALRVKRRVP